MNVKEMPSGELIIGDALEDYIIMSTIKKMRTGLYRPVVGRYHVTDLTSLFCVFDLYHKRKEVFDDIKEGVITREKQKIKQNIDIYKKFLRGEVLHEAFQEAYRFSYNTRTSIEHETRARIESKYFPGELITIMGIVDIYDMSPHINEVIELKTVSPFAMKRVPYEFHIEQANAYALMLEADRYRIVYIDADNLNTKEFVGRPDETMFEKMGTNADVIFYMEKTDGELPKDFTLPKPPRFKCAGCPYGEECSVLPT